LFAPNPDSLTEAKEMIDSLLAKDDTAPEFEFGAILTATVVEVKERGVLVRLHANLEPVLIHISQLSASKVSCTHVIT